MLWITTSILSSVYVTCLCGHRRGDLRRGARRVSVIPERLKTVLVRGSRSPDEDLLEEEDGEATGVALDNVADARVIVGACRRRRWIGICRVPGATRFRLGP